MDLLFKAKEDFIEYLKGVDEKYNLLTDDFDKDEVNKLLTEFLESYKVYDTERWALAEALYVKGYNILELAIEYQTLCLFTVTNIALQIYIIDAIEGN